MNPNPSGLDPTARSFTGQYSQLQNQGNMYQMGSGLSSLQQLQGGLQSQQLGARTGFGAMPSSSNQPGERFQSNFSQLNQYQQQAQTRHPGLALGNYTANPAARNQFSGTQLGMQSQGGLGAHRPLMNAANMNVPGFGGVSQNPQALQGMQLWSTAGQQSMPISNLHSLSSINRLAALNPQQQQQQQLAQVRSMNPLGQNISRDFRDATITGLLQQQQQNPNPSQDLLSIMRYGNNRQHQSPYGGLMQQMPQLQTQTGASTLGGGFGAGRSALPLERPTDPAMMSSALGGLGLNATEFPSLSGGTNVSSISGRPAIFPNPTESEMDRSFASKEEFPALAATIETQPPKTSTHGPIGRMQQPVGASTSLTNHAIRSAAAPATTASQTYFHGSHNMPSSVQDSLKSIQASQSTKNPSVALPGHMPSAQQRAAGTLPLQQLPPQTDTAALDRFSLLGLNSVIMTANEDLAMLALGLDLTQLGLKLDNPGTHLHKTFISPWSDHQAPGEHSEFDIPKCYKNAAEKLRPEHLAKFRDETLFFIFYSSPGEEAQALASSTLINRGLAWHKDQKQWFMRVPNMNPQKSPDGERGSYIFFDTNQWKYVQKDNFLVKYDAIETATNLHRSQIPLAMK